MSRQLSSAIFLLSACLLAACAGTTKNSGPVRSRGSVGVEIPAGGVFRVTEDLIVTPGEYLRPVENNASAILLDGLRGVSIDLRGVTLRGAPVESAPDAGRGVGLQIRNCEDLTVIGGTFAGYRVGVLVQGSDGVRIEGCEFTPVYGKRLGASGADGGLVSGFELDLESPSRALFSRGAGLAILNSSRVEVRDVSARGGENGILVVGSENCELLDNDLSYLSGFGIVLESSNLNTLKGNHCDGVTRRYLGGRTEADHGATGILLTRGSSENVISGNWVRGTTTGLRLMPGERPCKQNRIVANDFSNARAANVSLDGSWDTWFLDNRLTGGEGSGVHAEGTTGLALCGNEIGGIIGSGIYLGGGSRAMVRDNRFTDCDAALRIRGGASSGNLDHWVAQNRFHSNIQDLVLENARGLEFWKNDFESADALAHLDGLRAAGGSKLRGREVWAWLKDAQGHLPTGRSFNSELRWASPQPPSLLAVISAWRRGGNAQESIKASPAPGNIVMGDFAPRDPSQRSKEHVNESQFDPLGEVSWEVTWFAWSERDSDPRGDIEAWRARRYEALARTQVSSWSDPWGSNKQVRADLPDTYFGLIATGELLIEQAGEYLLSANSDDGVRVRIDGEVLLEDWGRHPERRRSQKIELEAGSHPIEVEYFQMDGTAVFSLDLEGPAGL